MFALAPDSSTPTMGKLSPGPIRTFRLARATSAEPPMGTASPAGEGLLLTAGPSAAGPRLDPCCALPAILAPSTNKSVIATGMVSSKMLVRTFGAKRLRIAVPSHFHATVWLVRELPVDDLDAAAVVGRDVSAPLALLGLNHRACDAQECVYVGRPQPYPIIGAGRSNLPTVMAENGIKYPLPMGRE